MIFKKNFWSQFSAFPGYELIHLLFRTLLRYLEINQTQPVFNKVVKRLKTLINLNLQYLIFATSPIEICMSFFFNF